MVNKAVDLERRESGKARLLAVGGGGKASASHHISLRDFNYMFLMWLSIQPREHRLRLMRECKEDIRVMGEEKAIEKWYERLA